MVKDDNKQKLIKATDALLKDRSISSITTKEITKAAGVSVGVFYNYFSSKEDVFKTNGSFTKRSYWKKYSFRN